MTSMDTPAAQQAFDSLLVEQAASCLWFLRDVQSLSVEAPAAETVLSAIIRHGTRDAWHQANKLQAWRSLHTK